MFEAGNAAAKQDVDEGEQVLGNVEGQVDAEDVSTVEAVPVVLAGEGKEFVGEQET